MSADAPGPHAEREALARVFGLRDVIAICIAAIIGVGIFFTPASVVQRTGDGGLALWAWACGGAAALLGALTFAELAAMLPKVGGQFAIIREAFGRRLGFLSLASVTLTVQCGAIGILAIICAENVLRGIGRPPGGGAVSVVALAAIAAVYVINVAGVRESVAVLRWNVALKLLTLGGIVGLAAFATGTEPTEPPPPDLDAKTDAWSFAYALVPTLFAYGGFEQILWIAGEVRRPERNIARGIIAGVVAVVTAYVAVNVAYLSVLGEQGVAQDSLVAARAVEAAAPGLGRIVAFAVAASALGTTHAIVLTSPRQVVALARDGLLPTVFGAVSRRGAPVCATTFIAGVSAALVLVAGARGIDALLDALICVNWAFFALTGAALFVLRRTRPALPRPFRVPGYPVVPAVFVAVAAAAAASPFFNSQGRAAAIAAAVLVALLWGASRFWIREPNRTKSRSVVP